MKRSSFFGLLLLSSCATHEVRIPLPPATVSALRTPRLILPRNADGDMVSAEKVFHAYANSDEFYVYVRRTVKTLAGGNETNVEAAITRYRSCLSTHAPVPIVFKNYSGRSSTRVIGGWRKNYLAQNRLKEMNAIDRAAHWVHELTHACGFTHVDNDIVLRPEIKKSFPYQIGNAFRDFVEAKAF